MNDDTSRADSEGSAAEIRSAWEARARSPFREFYVASHRGWDVEDVVEEHARFDAEVVLHDLTSEQLAQAHVLEIGSGSGRLASQIAPRVASYTGFDIAPTMVSVAKERLSGCRNARVLIGDGQGIPAEASDRKYDLIFSHAVLIHCPRDIIASYIRAAWLLVAEEGEVRMQLLADPSDKTGILPLENVPTLPVPPPSSDLSSIRPEEEHALHEIKQQLEGTYYMGHGFRYDEVEPFLRELVPTAEMRIMRATPEHVYVDLRQPPRSH